MSLIFIDTCIYQRTCDLHDFCRLLPTSATRNGVLSCETLSYCYCINLHSACYTLGKFVFSSFTFSIAAQCYLNVDMSTNVKLAIQVPAYTYTRNFVIFNMYLHGQLGSVRILTMNSRNTSLTWATCRILCTSVRISITETSLSNKLLLQYDWQNLYGAIFRVISEFTAKCSSYNISHSTQISSTLI